MPPRSGKREFLKTGPAAETWFGAGKVTNVRATGDVTGALNRRAASEPGRWYAQLPSLAGWVIAAAIELEFEFPRFLRQQA